MSCKAYFTDPSKVKITNSLITRTDAFSKPVRLNAPLHTRRLAFSSFGEMIEADKEEFPLILSRPRTASRSSLGNLHQGAQICLEDSAILATTEG